MDMSLSKLQQMVKTGKPGVLQSTGWQRVRHDLVTEQQQVTEAEAKKEAKGKLRQETTGPCRDDLVGR